MREQENIALTGWSADTWRRIGLAAATCAMAGLAAASPAAQKDPALSALRQLEPGMWQLRDLDDRNAAPRTICVADPERLLQVQHVADRCSRVVHRNRPDGTIITYNCPGSGSGRTWMRVETSRLAQIETQGLRNRSPFSYRLEARRVGACNGEPPR